MDAHSREYAGAVAGWQETTLLPLTQPRAELHWGTLYHVFDVGANVQFRDADGDLVRGVVTDRVDLETYHVAVHVPGVGRCGPVVVEHDKFVFP